MLRPGAGACHPDAAMRDSPPACAPSPSPSPSPSTSTPAAAVGAAHAPTLPQLYASLNECLQLEHKFQPRLCLPDESESGAAEVTTGARDGAAHVLRSLKIWFDLPVDVLIHAINLFDRFLTKMKVRPCHVPCITVSCMDIAIEEYARSTREPRKVTVHELVSISQSACTARDVARLSAVVQDKLALVSGSGGGGAGVTPLRWLRLLRALVAAAAAELGLPEDTVAGEDELAHSLELAVCDAACANARGCELALVLIYDRLERTLSSHATTEAACRLLDFGAQLQAHCRMCPWSLVSCRGRARGVLARYEARAGAPHRQRLVWRLSERTLKVLRPTDKLTTVLPTIEEQHLACDGASARNRSGSESSESETSDWPRSPVLPVYCSN